MGKWIFGIIGTVIAGLLLAYATNVLNLDGRGGDKTAGASIPTSDPPPTPPKKGKVVMSALEPGINRQGQDFDDIGRIAENAPVCAQMCLDDDSCDSMTYVVSTRRCWLKSGAPATSPNPDMTSAIKIRPS